MTSRFCTTAAVFALLTVTTPARAAYVPAHISEDINLNFGAGYTASGSLTFLYIPTYI